MSPKVSIRIHTYVDKFSSMIFMHLNVKLMRLNEKATTNEPNFEQCHWSQSMLNHLIFT